MPDFVYRRDANGEWKLIPYVDVQVGDIVRNPRELGFRLVKYKGEEEGQLMIACQLIDDEELLSTCPE